MYCLCNNVMIIGTAIYRFYSTWVTFTASISWWTFVLGILEPNLVRSFSPGTYKSSLGSKVSSQQAICVVLMEDIARTADMHIDATLSYLCKYRYVNSSSGIAKRGLSIGLDKGDAIYSILKLTRVHVMHAASQLKQNNLLLIRWGFIPLSQSDRGSSLISGLKYHR